MRKAEQKTAKRRQESVKQNRSTNEKAKGKQV